MAPLSHDHPAARTRTVSTGVPATDLQTRNHPFLKVIFASPITHHTSLITGFWQMPLLTLADGQLSYGELPLLDSASFAMETGERIGLIGRNGTGKSSLLGIIAGRVALDDGELRSATPCGP